MLNFEYYNPVKIIFGKDTIAKLAEEIPQDEKIMLLYGGGSIFKNGVHQQVTHALKDHQIVEFGGIEPNPHYETCMRAVDQIRESGTTFLLAVGGGSVVDATKFISAAACYPSEKDPWEFMEGPTEKVERALPIATVITLPATGSEMNCNAVITRHETCEKRFFGNPNVYPKFSILDPQVTFSLPDRQTANGIVDAFIHVAEQYMTFPVNAPLQDRQAEAVLATLIEEAPKVMDNPDDYDARANIMWAASHALNFIICCGVPQDWTAHMIGHEITAEYGIDHARTLALVAPAIWRHEKARKHDKLLQFAERIWKITEGPDDQRIEQAITYTEKFFNSLGVATRQDGYNLPGDFEEVITQRVGKLGFKMGEHADIGQPEAERILAMTK